jgi:hypothetical protein
MYKVRLQAQFPKGQPVEGTLICIAGDANAEIAYPNLTKMVTGFCNRVTGQRCIIANHIMIAVRSL